MEGVGEELLPVFHSQFCETTEGAVAEETTWQLGNSSNSKQNSSIQARQRAKDPSNKQLVTRTKPILPRQRGRGRLFIVSPRAGLRPSAVPPSKTSQTLDPG